MTLRFSPLLVAAAAATVFGGATLAASGNPKEAQELATALKGRTAGKPTNCVRNTRGAQSMQIINDNTILFRSGGTVYLQRPDGGCPGIKNGRYTLVLRQFGDEVCQGDIHQLVDLSSGVSRAGCVFGPFIPYRKN